MKNLLTLLLLILSVNSYCQKKNIIVPIYPLTTTTPVVLPNGDTTANLYIVQAHLDSLKTLYGLLATVNSNITVQGNRFKGISDSLKSLYGIISNIQSSENTMSSQITTLQSSQSATAQTVANQGLQLTAQGNHIASLQIQVDNIVIPPTQGIPASITITVSQTLPITLGFNADIWMNCNGCTVTLPIMQKDWHWKIHNKWTSSGGTGQIRTISGLSTVNSVTSIARSSRPLDITYYSSNLVEIK